MPRENLIINPEPLPETNETLHLRREPRLNDRVKQLLMDGAYAEVKSLLESVGPNNAIHGSVLMDRAEAARVLQNYAKDRGDTFVANKSRAEIDKALERSLKTILNADGQPIDRKSRKLAAITKNSQAADNG